MREYVRFLALLRLSFVGDWRYLGVDDSADGHRARWAQRLLQATRHGLAPPGMTDQVSWGLYIANFTFLVGMAAAAVMLVIPVYVYRNRELHDLVIFGELLAVARSSCACCS